MPTNDYGDNATPQKEPIGGFNFWSAIQAASLMCISWLLFTGYQNSIQIAVLIEQVSALKSSPANTHITRLIEQNTAHALRHDDRLRTLEDKVSAHQADAHGPESRTR